MKIKDKKMKMVAAAKRRTKISSVGQAERNKNQEMRWGGSTGRERREQLHNNDFMVDYIRRGGKDAMGDFSKVNFNSEVDRKTGKVKPSVMHDVNSYEQKLRDTRKADKAAGKKVATRNDVSKAEYKARRNRKV